MYYNEKVYIMGQENAKQNRLIYDEQNTRVIRESAWAKHLGRWIEKYRKKNEEVMIQSTWSQNCVDYNFGRDSCLLSWTSLQKRDTIFCITQI